MLKLSEKENENMEVPRYWRQRQQRYSLTGKVCPQCNEKFVAARPVCPHCGYPINTYSQETEAIAVYMPEMSKNSLPIAGGD
jgi:uncharacterized OB-fold protein